LGEERVLKVNMNRVLRKIFASKREEVAAGYRKLHHEDLHNFCSSPDIVKAIKSRIMK
jgi:hypothetical protein